jgi:hypothetical protein
LNLEKEKQDFYNFIHSNREAFMLLKQIGLTPLLRSFANASGGGGVIPKNYVQTYLPYMPTGTTSFDNVTFTIPTYQSNITWSGGVFTDYYWRLADVPSTVNGNPISLNNPFRVSFGISGFWTLPYANDPLHPAIRDQSYYTLTELKLSLFYDSTTVSNHPSLTNASPINNLPISFSGIGYAIGATQCFFINPNGNSIAGFFVGCDTGGGGLTHITAPNSKAICGIVTDRSGGNANTFGLTGPNSTIASSTSTRWPTTYTNQPNNCGFTIEYYSQLPYTLDNSTPYFSIYFHYNLNLTQPNLNFGTAPTTLTYAANTNGFTCYCSDISTVSTDTYRFTVCNPSILAGSVILRPYFGVSAIGNNVNSLVSHTFNMIRLPIYYGW